MNGFFLPLTEPLGILWLLMFAQLCWLLARRHWKSSMCLGISTFLLFLFGSTPLTEMIVGAAEAVVARERPKANAGKDEGETSGNRKSSAEDGKVGNGTVVLVLGGGYYASDMDPHNFAISEGGNRVLRALELLRKKKGLALVLGGGLPVPGRPGLAVPLLMEEWIGSWGLAKTATVVTNLGICMNTHDEALQFQKLENIYGWRKVLLVTSALHMPRSEALFKRQGIAVEPVACDFKVYGVPRTRHTFSLFPRESRLQILGLYLHEKIGWWVYRIRGWV